MNLKRLLRSLGGTLILASAVLFSGALSVLAQAGDPIPEEKPKSWEATAAAGLTLTSGNSETFLANLSLNASRKWARDEVLFGAAFGYGEDKTSGVKNRTQDYLNGFAQYNHLFTPRFYVGGRLDGLRDSIADILYRFTVGPLAGYYFIKEKKMTLSGEAGLNYVTEKKGGVTKDYMGVRFADRFDYQLTKTTKIWQYAEFIPQVDDFNNYLVNLEVGISTAITKALSLRFVVVDNYANKPAKNRRSNDLKLIAGVGYDF